MPAAKRAREDEPELATPRPAPSQRNRESQGPPSAAPGATPGRTKVRCLKIVDATFNVSNIVCDSASSLGLHALSQSSPEVLLGLEGHGKKLEAYGLFTIADLAVWQPYVLARALHNLEGAEDLARPNPNLNIHRAVHRAFEDKSVGEMLAQPLSTLVCVGSRVDDDFKSLGITCLRELADWPQAAHAAAIADLACYEHQKLVGK